MIRLTADHIALVLVGSLLNRFSQQAGLLAREKSPRISRFSYSEPTILVFRRNPAWNSSMFNTVHRCHENGSKPILSPHPQNSPRTPTRQKTILEKPDRVGQQNFVTHKSRARTEIVPSFLEENEGPTRFSSGNPLEYLYTQRGPNRTTLLAPLSQRLPTQVLHS